MPTVWLIAAAAAWGAAAGAALPRAAYRLSVPHGDAGVVTTGGAGAALITGGAEPSGGRPSSGGVPSSGGALSSGGVLSSGGALSSGDVPPSGSVPSAGGSPSGRVPSAGGACPSQGPQPSRHNEWPPGARAEPPEPPAWRTACPAGHPLAGPLGGWVGPGRCGECAGAGYGPSGRALAAVTALLCAALAAATGPRPELAVWLLLGPVGVLLAVVDLRVHRLPDVLTLPLAVAAPALLGLAALAPGHAGDWSGALLGTLALGAGYLVLCRINPAGMGFGDVKLSLSMGAVLGWYGPRTLLLGTFAAFLLGALYAGALVALRRAGRGTAIAFGPFLLAGALIGVVSGAYAA